MVWSLCAFLSIGHGLVYAADTEEGVVQGRVMTHTAPSHPIVHQAVHLEIVERAASSMQETVTDAGGRFRFTRLPVGGIRVFVLSTEYGGVRYSGERLALLPAAPVRTVDLVVYEPSTDRAALRPPVVFAVVEVARGALRVSVVQRLENPTDRTIVSSPRDPLVFPLSPGAQSVRFLSGWVDPRVDSGTITDAFPVTPGRTEVAYAYTLDARQSEVAVPWVFPDGAGEVDVLVADVGVKASADGLAARGAVEGPTGRFLRWSGGPISPRRRVVLRLQGVPLARDPWPAAVAAGLALILAGGLARSLWRARRPAPHA